MALVAYLDWEVRTTGHDLNCSGFNPNRDPTNGVDYTQQDNAEITSLNWVVDSTNNTWIRSTELTNWVNSGKTLASLKGNHIHIAGKAIGGNTLFQWVASTAVPGAYYLQALGGGNPNWTTKPTIFWMNKTFVLENTSLPAGANSWTYGDKDSLDYSTIYVRFGAESDANPNSKAQDDIIADGQTWTRGAYEIVTVGTDGNGPYLVLDRSPGAAGSVNGYGRIGGAMASPGGVGSILGGVGFIAWVYAGTYSVSYLGSRPSVNWPGSFQISGSSSSVVCIGYDNNGKGNEPNSYPIVDLTNGPTDEGASNYGTFIWLKFINTSGYRYLGNYPTLWYCKVEGQGTGFVGIVRGMVYCSYIYRGSMVKGNGYFSYYDSCTGHAGERLWFCVVKNSTFPVGGEYYGDNYNTVVYGAGLSSYYMAGQRGITYYRNCVVVNATNLQANWDRHVHAEGIYYYAVTNANTGNAKIFPPGVIALPGNPFRDPDNGDFRLADNEAGRMLKQAGFQIPGPQGAPPMRFDAGAVQNSFYDIQGSGGAVVPLPMMFGA